MSFVEFVEPEEYQRRRRKWTDGLLSGRYRQTVQALQDQNGYCCLGVACAESGLVEWNPFEGAHGLPVFAASVGDDHKRYASELPPQVAEYYGLTDTRGSSDHRDSLDMLNDSGWTFPEIAAIIQAEPAGLFRSP